jgi:ArsR family transcriptional regulator, lead/cadmium/zinc/bismuth-responsive transcriptional repressor
MSDTCELLCLDLPKAEAIRARQVDPSEAQRAASRAQALADPTRLSLAAALAETDELCGCDLAWVTGRSQKLISHHLKVLRNVELVRSRRDGKIVFFSLTEPGRTLLGAVLTQPHLTA